MEEGALSFTLLVNPIRGNLGQNTQGALRVMRPSWMTACARRRRRIQVGTTHPACNYGHTHHDDSLSPSTNQQNQPSLAFPLIVCDRIITTPRLFRRKTVSKSKTELSSNIRLTNSVTIPIFGFFKRWSAHAAEGLYGETLTKSTAISNQILYLE